MNNTDNRSVSGEEIYLEIDIQSSFLCDTICQLLSFPLPLLMSQSSLFIVQKKKEFYIIVIQRKHFEKL